VRLGPELGPHIASAFEATLVHREDDWSVLSVAGHRYGRSTGPLFTICWTPLMFRVCSIRYEPPTIPTLHRIRAAGGDAGDFAQVRRCLLELGFIDTEHHGLYYGGPALPRR